MAEYASRSRFVGGKYSTFRDKKVVFPRRFDISTIAQIGTYTIVPETEYRPDIIGYIIYGDASLWWYLMMYNKINQVSELKTGVVLKIPSREDL